MIKTDIKIANKILDGYSEDYDNDHRNVIYDIATEEIDHFLPVLNIEDSNILTIAGGGDQIISCALFGAKSIDTFDLNPFQIYYSKLKVAAIKALTREEFNKFFYNTDYSSIYSNKIYSKIREYLDIKTRLFFDSLYKNGLNYKFENLISNFHMDEGFSIIPSYSKEDYYSTAKDRVEKIDINYMICDLLKIHKNTKKEYDLIMLSNVYKWLYCKKYLTDEEKKNKFMKFVNNRLINLLSDNGIIQLYSSASGYKEKSLGLECLKNSNMNHYSYLQNEMITLKKTRL